MTNNKKRRLMKKSSGPDVTELIDKIQEQLVSLERKVDTLISRAVLPPQQQRQFEQPRHSDRVFYKIVCADCNKQSEIPFRPSPGRPVYCKECFSRRRNSNNIFKPKIEEPKETVKKKKAAKKKKRSGS